MFLFYDWLFLHVRNLYQGNLLFSTLILGSLSATTSSSTGIAISVLHSAYLCHADAR